jgi:hypothetical protein
VSKLFSLFKKHQFDLSSPVKFRESVLANKPTASDLINQKLWQSFSKQTNPREYMEVLEELGLAGNVACQEVVAQFSLITADNTTDINALRQLRYKALRFGVLAAESGVTQEALNIPITALKLVGILTEENGGQMDEEVISLVQLAYKWHLSNANNGQISSGLRKQAAAKAEGLKDALPELE